MIKKPSELRYGDVLESDGSVIISAGAAEQPDGTWSVMLRETDGRRTIFDYRNDFVPVILADQNVPA